MRSERWLVLAAFACGCAYDWDALRYDPDAFVAPDRVTPDATPDARADREGPDAAPDARADREAPDAAPDAPDDVAADLAVDAPRDAGPDALDASPDVAPDVARDVGLDAAPDVALDAAPDASPDVAPDVAPDLPPACTTVGMTCPCAMSNPGGYCRPGESCTSGRCVAGTVTGSLVITEIMNDPNAVSDEMGEWVEVHNPGMTPLDLRGLRIGNNRSQTTTLSATGTPAVLAPGGYAVLARNTVAGVTPLWVYGMGLATNTLTFSNSAAGDTVILDLGSSATEIDRVAYNEAAMWPYTAGRAKSLRPTALSATANDMPTNWCPAPMQWAGAGDYGSPGAANPACP